MLRRSARALPGVVAMALVAIGAIVGFAPAAAPVAPWQVRVSGGGAAGQASVSGTWHAPKPTRPTSFVVADAIGPQVHLYRAPGVPYEPRPTMDNPTWEGLPVVFLVLEDQGPWLHVRVS